MTDRSAAEKQKADQRIASYRRTIYKLEQGLRMEKVARAKWETRARSGIEGWASSEMHQARAAAAEAEVESLKELLWECGLDYTARYARLGYKSDGIRAAQIRSAIRAKPAGGEEA